MEIELPSLYPHQHDFVGSVRESIKQHRAVIGCGVTGFGKSRCAKYMMGASANRPIAEGQSGNSVFAVHRRGLVDNIHDSFNESPRLPHGLIMSGAETRPGCRVQVASIDTLLSWYCEGGDYASEMTFDFCVFDEAHSHHGKWHTFLTAHAAKREQLGLRPPFVLGLTATPRAKGLSDVYREIVYGPSPEWLQENGYAAKFRYLSGTKGDLSKLKRRGNDYTNASVCDAMDGLAGDFVRDWKQHARFRPTVGFFPRLSQAKEARDLLEQAGIRARYVDGKTPDDERRALFLELAYGEYDYLCNVGIVERGTDIPVIGCIQLCTSVGNRARYLQMIGRGARIKPDGGDCLVIDHGGNIRHGYWEDDHTWVLDYETSPAEEHQARPVIECPQCPAVYRGGKCRECGYEPSPKERKQQGLVFDGSELREFKKEDRKKKSFDPEKHFIACLYKAGRSRRTWKQACGMAVGAAKKDGHSFRVPKRFKVGGTEYQSIPYGHPDGNRRVEVLFPFTSMR